ncbi:MAG: hypothetical protein GY855_06615 [candidate division Zixibacteria bacterium]|nr:hypothetical protein [candidate division Zixibacteria bacterium]
MWFRDGFRSGDSQTSPSDKLNEKEIAALDEFAKEVVRLKMTVAAIMFLESVKPVNWIGSQGMVVAEPLAQPFLSVIGNVFRWSKILAQHYDTFQTAFEKRETIEILIQKIEELDAVAYAKDKALKKEKRKNRKGFFSRFRKDKGGGKI